MAVQTKAQLELQLHTSMNRAVKAENELSAFKERVSVVLREKIEEYDLDLCPDGIEDFCKTLGIALPEIEADASINVFISKLSLKAHRGSYGIDFDDTEVDKLTDILDHTIKNALKEYGSLDIEVEVNQY